jgi:hypothetical protein
MSGEEPLMARTSSALRVDHVRNALKSYKANVSHAVLGGRSCATSDVRGSELQMSDETG